MIHPKSDEFTRNPEYFIYKSKRENFRGLNLCNTLSSLNIDSKPFYSKEAKVKIKETKFNKETIVISKDKKPLEFKNPEVSKIDKTEKYASYNTNNINMNANGQQAQRDDFDETLKKLRIISMGEIREYIPKNFKLVKNTK